MSQADFPFLTFKSHFRQKYGEPVGKLPLHIGLPCPNRKKGGCIYCTAQGFTPYHLKADDSLTEQINKGLVFLKQRKYRKYFAYFQQETTTALEVDRLLPLFSQATEREECIGLIVSTRPDYVDEPLICALEHMAENGKEIHLELGLQSVHEQTLQFLNRNHSFEDFRTAARRIKKNGLVQLGVHLILGIPGEGEEEMRQSVRKVVELDVDGIKFHHLLVYRNTPLAEIYSRQPFPLFTAPDYISLLARLIALVPAHIVLQRLWSTANPDLLIGPKWDLRTFELQAMLKKQMHAHGLRQGKHTSTTEMQHS